MTEDNRAYIKLLMILTGIVSLFTLISIFFIKDNIFLLILLLISFAILAVIFTLLIGRYIGEISFEDNYIQKRKEGIYEQIYKDLIIKTYCISKEELQEKYNRYLT